MRGIVMKPKGEPTAGAWAEAADAAAAEITALSDVLLAALVGVPGVRE